MQSSVSSHQIPLLIFDFDGTLADTLGIAVEIFNELAGDYGLKKLDEGEAKKLRKLNTRAQLEYLGVSRILAVKLGARMRRLLSKRIEEVPLDSGVEKMIYELRAADIELGILSSNAVDNVRRYLHHHHLADCFHFVEAGASFFGKGLRLRKILKRERRKALGVMYAGDETRDIEAARNAGLQGIGVCWGATGREALLTEDPDICADTPADLIAGVLKLVKI